MKIIAYYRVSTAKQGQSGLGLEAQQEAVANYASSVGAALLDSYIEVESGRKADRPQLQAAIDHTRLTGATLVIARLDRLSRNAAFLLNLRDSGIEFLAADMPSANSLTVGVMALVAEEEAQAISKRTKVALAAAKARGTRLGNPQGAKAFKGKSGVAESVKARQQAADALAQRVCPVVSDIIRSGKSSLRQIAEELNARGIRTARGGDWHASSVRNLKARCDAMADAR